jgi:hypothetical protein
MLGWLTLQGPQVLLQRHGIECPTIDKTPHFDHFRCAGTSPANEEMEMGTVDRDRSLIFRDLAVSR